VTNGCSLGISAATGTVPAVPEIGVVRTSRPAAPEAAGFLPHRNPKAIRRLWRRPAGRWYCAAASISICINDKRDRQGGNGPNSRPASRSCGPSQFRAQGIGTPDRPRPSAPTAPPTSTMRRCRWRSGRRRERVARAEPLCPDDPSEPTADRRPGLDHIAMTLDPRAAPAAVAALCNARSRSKGDRNAG
jgi:hypothetical protein